MIYLSTNASTSINNLFYFPYTFGKHIDKANNDLKQIDWATKNLPLVVGQNKVTVRGIGTFTYISDGIDIVIQFISWNSLLSQFYYKKSNFIIFTSKGNIPSVHPSLYEDRNEDYFRCDNGYKVVSRKYKGEEVFNFKDEKGNIISDIDFVQVKPFSEYKDMTARGYTPDRRCYMVFENGDKEEVNESRKAIDKIVIEVINQYLKQNLILN